jgi:hypothetical protein
MFAVLGGVAAAEEGEREEGVGGMDPAWKV